MFLLQSLFSCDVVCVGGGGGGGRRFFVNRVTNSTSFSSVLILVLFQIMKGSDCVYIEGRDAIKGRK